MRAGVVAESAATVADAVGAVSARAAKVGAGAEIDVRVVSVRVVRAATTAVCDTVVAKAGAGLALRAPIKGNLRMPGSAMTGIGRIRRTARVTGTVRANTRVNLVDRLSITAVVARAAPSALETRGRVVVRRDHVAPVRSNSRPWACLKHGTQGLRLRQGAPD